MIQISEDQETTILPKYRTNVDGQSKKILSFLKP